MDEQQSSEQQAQDTGPGWKEKIKRFIAECRRVLIITKKPDKIEFSTIVKISALGIALIGLIGFLIQMTKTLVFG